MKAIATAGITNFGMMKGSIPFDLAKLQSGLKLYQDEAPKLKALFPEDSKFGVDWRLVVQLAPLCQSGELSSCTPKFEPPTTSR